MTERTPKISWTPEEDAHLTSLIKEHGTSWSIIENNFPHRDAKSCKNRFAGIKYSTAIKIKNLILFKEILLNRHQYLKRRTTDWTDEEDEKLRQAVEDNRRAFSDVWRLVAEKIPDRTWQQCEKRWNSIPKPRK
ncbi:10740_t:CDS:2 [Cetraspora pellucida]|uniref:10740_t:CDS:1 n=1 Tax=Cetraspora pellucida TaxID=1433469 RepID=A0A9N9AXD2_9GLOM|nr:10740_t:CDS:2 [Cetraspora pellucida]